MLDHIFTTALALVLFVGSTLILGAALVGNHLSGASALVKSVRPERVIVIGNHRPLPAATPATTGCTDAGASQ